MWRLIPITALSTVLKFIGRYWVAMKDAILVVLRRVLRLKVVPQTAALMRRYRTETADLDLVAVLSAGRMGAKIVETGHRHIAVVGP